MSDSAAPRLEKWPFLLGDLLLIGFAIFLVRQSPAALSFGQGVACLIAVFAGACLSIVPFLKDQQTAQSIAEARALATTVAQIGDLEKIKSQIVGAAAQWQDVQQYSREAVTAAREISSRMKSELGEACEFLKRAQDAEKGHLRLEVDKLRRAESDWLQAMVHVLDHVFALHKAASRSGQPALVAQLDQFQHACRDIVRRLGLVAFAPAPSELFDSDHHQVQDPEANPSPSAQISEGLAPGYTYQGRLVRRALVLVKDSEMAGLATVIAPPTPGATQA